MKMAGKRYSDTANFKKIKYLSIVFALVYYIPQKQNLLYNVFDCSYEFVLFSAIEVKSVPLRLLSLSPYMMTIWKFFRRSLSYSLPQK